MLSSRLWFPDPRHAAPDGLVAVGGDLSVERLLLAYRSGIFPWTANPVSWWSPDPRGVFSLDHIHIPRSLRPILNRGQLRVTFDQAFNRVVRACASALRDDQDTWITAEFIEAYTAFHEAGHAHSVEVWNTNTGDLEGGLYGVAVGGFFAGESMFHKATGASKVALLRLQEHLSDRGFKLFDTQMVTEATQLMGAYAIDRSEYLNRLEKAIDVRCSFL